MSILVDLAKSLLKEEENTVNVTELIINDKVIHSLPELRNYSIEDLIKSYIDGSLSAWLKSHFYYAEYEKISALNSDMPNLKQRIGEILKLTLINDEVDEKVARKMDLIKGYVDEKNLKEIASYTATNQTELAEFIVSNKNVIYLYKDIFSIPITKPGIKYIGINNPVIENAFTKIQYKKAGITIENVSLPQNSDDKKTEIAREAAINNGFDFFYEEHSPLACKIHQKLKRDKYYNYYQLPYGDSLKYKDFKSKYECEKAAEKCVETAYNYANNTLGLNSNTSVYREAVKYYSNKISDIITPYLPAIKGFCISKNKSAVYSTLNTLISNSSEELKRSFEEEITDNTEYYQMYDYTYFKDKINIREHDYRMSEGVLWVIETLFTDNVEYTFDGAYESIAEMEKDLNSKAVSYFKAVHREYEKIVSEIEKLIEQIGVGLPEFKENEDIEEYLIRIA